MCLFFITRLAEPLRLSVSQLMVSEGCQDGKRAKAWCQQLAALASLNYFQLISRFRAPANVSRELFQLEKLICGHVINVLTRNSERKENTSQFRGLLHHYSTRDLFRASTKGSGEIDAAGKGLLSRKTKTRASALIYLCEKLMLKALNSSCP